MEKTNIEKLIPYVKRYVELNKKKDEISKIQDELKVNVAQFLHENNINETTVPIEGTDYFCGYQSTTRQHTDLNALLEMVGLDKFKQIVEDRTSSSLTIRKSARKKNDILKEKPIKDVEDEFKIPEGIILT